MIDENLKREINDLYMLLKPVHQKLENLIIDYNEKLVLSSASNDDKAILVGKTYAIYIVINDFLDDASDYVQIEEVE